MRSFSIRHVFLLLGTVCVLLAQRPPLGEKQDIKLPNGKSQNDAIVRADYERNLRDAGELVRVADEIKNDLERGDRYLVSLQTLKKLDEVEKLSKDIRQRLRRQ